MTFQILDNFLKQEDFDFIKNKTMCYSFPLHYANEVNENDSHNFYFEHNFYYQTEKTDQFPIIHNLLNALGIKSLIRAKLNCFPRTENLIIYGKHADYNFSHKGAILYLNTCDGGTYIKDDFIESKENRLLLFDSSQNHSSTNCTDKKCRYNININYF
jgi:hypothetical protein